MSGGINIERKSKWVHSCGVIKQVFEVISSTSTQVVYRNIDGYGQSTMRPFDFLQTFKPAPKVDDTFNDDTVAQTLGDIQWDMGTQDESKAVLVTVCSECGSTVPADSVAKPALSRWAARFLKAVKGIEVSE